MLCCGSVCNCSAVLWRVGLSLSCCSVLVSVVFVSAALCCEVLCCAVVVFVIVVLFGGGWGSLSLVVLCWSV